MTKLIQNKVLLIRIGIIILFAMSFTVFVAIFKNVIPNIASISNFYYADSESRLNAILLLLTLLTVVALLTYSIEFIKSKENENKKE